MMKENGEDGEETRSRGVSGSFPLPLPRDRAKKAVVWTIAGFDPSSGAGITADLMTFGAHGAFGCAAITALTVQSTMGVFGWQAVAPELLRDTLRRLHEDLPAVGIKIGMLGTPEAAEVLAEFLELAGADGKRPAVVYDPVLRSSSGRDLFRASGLRVLRERVLPRVEWLTPNWAELELLSGCSVHDLAGAETAARRLIDRYPEMRVLATGGDQEKPTDLLVIAGQGAVAIEGHHVASVATHGTGCAFSSALLVRFVQGCAPEDAARRAKRFVEGALRQAPGLGQGRGPMELLWTLQDSEEGRAAAVATLER